mgnify:CR=1 FL=1
MINVAILFNSLIFNSSDVEKRPKSVSSYTCRNDNPDGREAQQPDEQC